MAVSLWGGALMVAHVGVDGAAAAGATPVSRATATDPTIAGINAVQLLDFTLWFTRSPSSAFRSVNWSLTR
ncbi:MAG: hypothetical protein ACLP5O_00345 [Acidimicrobiales bacterium]